jgi:hypothetical protein
MTTPLSNFFACELSQPAGEQLYGTATRTDVWMLLEHRGAWGNEAFAESAIAQVAKDHLNAQLKAVPRSRLQLIKHSEQSAGSLAFFVVVARDSNPILYKFSLTHYEQVTKYDLAKIVAGAREYQSFISTDPLFLVCTNGKRDKCCSRFGLPLYQELALLKADNTWQTTHIGGHRFAATSVVLPHGLFYGRVPAGEGYRFADAYTDGQIYLPAFRGRGCYDEVVQAAEYYLRQRTMIVDVEHFRFISAVKMGHMHTVTFESIHDQKRHVVELEEQRSVFEIHKNSDNPEKGTVPQFYLR